MNSNSNKEKNTMTLKEALNKIDSIPPDNKCIEYFLKIYKRYQKQNEIKPEELIDLLLKGMDRFSEDGFKILMYIYAMLKDNSSSNPFVQAFILDKCIDKLQKLGCDISHESISDDFNNIIHNGNDESENIKLFMRDILRNNDNSENDKEKKDTILSIIYLFLANSIEITEKVSNKQKDLLLIMEQAFVEECLSCEKVDLRSSICHDIPINLAKGKIGKIFPSMSYLYYDYKVKNKTLNEEVKKYQDSIAYLNNMLKQKNEKVTNLESDLKNLNEENDKLNVQIQEITAEKEEAEDRLEFEKNRIERQYKSQNQGLAKEFNSTIGLEIDGVEDILEFASDDLKNAIQERLDRMRKIISEMGGK